MPDLVLGRAIVFSRPSVVIMSKMDRPCRSYVTDLFPIRLFSARIMESENSVTARDLAYGPRELEDG